MFKRDTLEIGFTHSVKSFVARSGKITDAQHELHRTLWPVFGLSLNQGQLCLEQTFGNKNPVIVEIGFGDGRTLLSMARNNPNYNFIGIEVYRSGIIKALAGIKQHNLSNIRLYCADAVEVIKNSIPDKSIYKVQIFFPDPWPKLRHHKRRLIKTEFTALLQSKLVSGGVLHMATDWEEYAQHMLQVVEAQDGWDNTAGLNNFAPRPESRPLTKFEQRGHRLGYGTWDLIFHKRHNI